MRPDVAPLSGAAIHAPWKMSPLEAQSVGFSLGRTYPEPIVDHAQARTRVLELYAPVLGKAGRGAATPA